MSRPRRGTEAVFYDTFADWTAEDQAAALKVLEALHRQRLREERRPNGLSSDTAARSAAKSDVGAAPIFDSEDR